MAAQIHQKAKAINQSIDGTMNQWIDQSINQSIQWSGNMSLDQSIEAAKKTYRFLTYQTDQKASDNRWVGRSKSKLFPTHPAEILSCSVSTSIRKADESALCREFPRRQKPRRQKAMNKNKNTWNPIDRDKPPSAWIAPISPGRHPSMENVRSRSGPPETSRLVSQAAWECPPCWDGTSELGEHCVEAKENIKEYFFRFLKKKNNFLMKIFFDKNSKPWEISK